MDTQFPDITPAQMLAWVTKIVAAAVVLFKLNLSDMQRAALVTILVGLGTVAWHFSDAWIRGKRNDARGKIKTAEIVSLTIPPDLPPDADDSLLPKPPPFAAQS